MGGFEDVPLFMTPRELAVATGQHENSVRRGIAEGRIPADKVNGRWLICRDTVFPNATRAVEAASVGEGGGEDGARDGGPRDR